MDDSQRVNTDFLAMNQGASALVGERLFALTGTTDPVTDGSTPRMAEALFATGMSAATASGSAGAPEAVPAGLSAQVNQLVPPARYLLTDGESTYFRNLPLAQLDTPTVSALLDARKAYKRQVFAEARARLEQQPDLPDVKPCVDLQPSDDGKCLQVQTPPPKAQASATAGAPDQVLIPAIRQKRAVVVGLNQYRDKRIPQLFSAVPDARAMRDTLSSQLGYEVSLLENPGKAELLAQLNRLAADLGEEDSLVIYFAGHGELVEKTGMGYWIPSDASATDPTGWISNADVSRWLGGVRSRQVVLISDSCYSGTFASGESFQAGGSASAALPSDELLRKRTVTVMSSGSDEPVADTGNNGHSVFAWSLLQQLQQLERWSAGQSVFAQVQVNVERELPQTPQYAASLVAGHELGGDFLFERRSKGTGKR